MPDIKLALTWDVVRVVTRLVSRLCRAIERPIEGFHNRTRAARRRMQATERMTPRQRVARQRNTYADPFPVLSVALLGASSGEAGSTTPAEGS